jgi:hypothetical protein
MKWKNYNEIKPPHGIEILAHNPMWIDEDYNPKGIRIGFEYAEGFVSAHYWNYQDCYMTISHTECDDNECYSDEIKNSIEPTLWIELDSLTSLLKVNE